MAIGVAIGVAVGRAVGTAVGSGGVLSATWVGGEEAGSSFNTLDIATPIMIRNGD